VVRRAQFFDGFCRWIQPEEMRIGFLLGGKVDAIRSPADEPGSSSKESVNICGFSAFRGHHGNSYVGVEKNISLQRLFRRQSSFHRVTISDWYPVPACLRSSSRRRRSRLQRINQQSPRKSGPGLSAR